MRFQIYALCFTPVLKMENFAVPLYWWVGGFEATKRKCVTNNIGTAQTNQSQYKFLILGVLFLITIRFSSFPGFFFSSRGVSKSPLLIPFLQVATSLLGGL
ncbi:hypothetical protein V6N13_003135 [Hibiscus sabdariffa]